MKNKKPVIRFKGFSEEWEEKKLGEVATETYGGGTPKTTEESYWNGNIPWFQSSDLTESKILDITQRKHISDEGLKTSATKLIPPNSIAIITRVGVGKLALLPFAYATSQDFLSLSNLNIDEKFGVYAIYKKIQGELNAVQGTSIKGITKNELLSKSFSVPKHQDEQTQIGNFFKNLDNLITLHQRKYEKLGILKKAMLEKMFPKNGANVPEIRFKGFEGAWEERKLEEIAEKVSVGIATSSSKYFTNFEHGIPFIKNQDIKDGTIDIKNLEAITHEFDEANKTKRIKTGDILTVRTGYPGLSAVVPEKLNNAQTFTTLITRLKADTVSPEFITIFINSDLGMKQTNGMQAGGAQKNINANTLKNLLIILPSISEQEKIGTYFKNLDNLLRLHEKELEKLKNLKKALLEKMFV